MKSILKKDNIQPLRPRTVVKDSRESHRPQNLKVDEKAIMSFIDQVRWLYEPEFGDFKRKVGLYIDRLVESQPALKSTSLRNYIAQMKERVVFNPDGDIESTRKVVLDLAQQLLSKVNGIRH